MIKPADNVELEKRLLSLTKACKKAGLRMTHQRLEVFKEVASSIEHPDAETVFSRVRERIPTISIDTVYRTLASLEDLGMVFRVGIKGGRARFDANTDEHHHFICNSCGQVKDLFLADHEKLEVPNAVAGVGFPESLHLQVRGTCEDCLKKS